LETGTYNSRLERLFWEISLLLEKISMMRADHIIANSPISLEKLSGKKGIRKEKLSLILESRIDFQVFKHKKDGIREKLDIGNETPLVLYIGWLQARKGIHYLCDAIPEVVSRFPDVVFLLKGEDTDTAPGGISFKKYILDFAEQHNISKNVRFLEQYLSEDDLVSLYSASDIFVFPSLYETFGWPVIEAMACERTVVATDTGIADEFKNEGVAIVPSGDSMALTGKLIHFLSLPGAEREKLGKNNRESVKRKFSFQKMVEDYIEVYEKTLHNRE